MRTVFWNDSTNRLNMIDQRLIPGELVVRSFESSESVAEAITNMTVRGAPAIGAAAAFGVVLAAMKSERKDINSLKKEIRMQSQALIDARPTAMNLSWAVNRMLAEADHYSGDRDGLLELLLASANRIADEDVAANKRMAEYGAALIEDGDSIVHHCNTGALAVVDWGTALGVIRTAFEQGKRIHVFVDETRPRLQGARLTAWELGQYGISYDIITDSASGHLMRTGQVQKVLFGADRVASNGDVANKIGTYMLALAAYDNGIPAYSVFPISTVDLSLKSGQEIEIENRDESEVLDIQSNHQQVTPEGASANNPAFDVTPNRLISACITEKGVVYPPYFRNLPLIMGTK